VQSISNVKKIDYLCVIALTVTKLGQSINKTSLAVAALEIPLSTAKF